MNEETLQNYLPQLSWLTHNDRAYACFGEQLQPVDVPLSEQSKLAIIIHHLTVIKISGIDALTFLQGQLTSDLSKTSSQPIACYCSRKGRIIAIVYIGQVENDFYLWLPTELSELVIKQLKKYSIGTKVLIQRLDVMPLALPETAPPELSSALLQNTPISKLFDWQLSFIDETHLKELPAILKQHNYHLVGDLIWHQIQLKNKVPSIYRSTVNQYLPHDLELHSQNAISFDKGCYIGQEIIARMHYKAKLKYHLEYSDEKIENPTPGIENIVDSLIINNCQQHLLLKKKTK